VFFAALTKVACERSFYRLHELSSDECRLIERALIDHSPPALQEVQRQFLALYTLPAKLKRLKGVNTRFVNRLDELISNLGEDYHQRVEDTVIEKSSRLQCLTTKPMHHS
jgi:hypothetical protein